MMNLAVRQRTQVATAQRSIESAAREDETVDLSWLGLSLTVDSYALDLDALRFVSSLISNMKPRHVVEFGSGLSTLVIARSCSDLVPAAKVTSVDHDQFYSRRAQDLLKVMSPGSNATFHVAPLVARKCFGKLMPVYDIRRKRFASLRPADIVLIDGPPAALGGRGGILFQALTLARPGTVVLLDDAARELESAAIAFWEKKLGQDISVLRLDGFARGLAAILVHVVRPIDCDFEVAT